MPKYHKADNDLPTHFISKPLWQPVTTEPYSPAPPTMGCQRDWRKGGEEAEWDSTCHMLNKRLRDNSSILRPRLTPREQKIQDKHLLPCVLGKHKDENNCRRFNKWRKHGHFSTNMLKKTKLKEQIVWFLSPSLSGTDCKHHPDAPVFDPGN